MNKVLTGLIAGGLIGAASVAVAMSDDRTKRHAMRNGKRALRKAENFMDNVNHYN